jgi:nicotinamidase-related amidase
MQNVFAEDTAWRTPWMDRIRPVVRRLAEHRPERTIFTRFLPPPHPEEMRGTWRRYYERWCELLENWPEKALFDLLPDLAALVPPARVIDKLTYSPWVEPELARLLEEDAADTLIISGAETDVCVLAAALGGVDRGYRVIIPADAICSSSDRTHDALMRLYHERYSQQIETASTEDLIAAWS